MRTRMSVAVVGLVCVGTVAAIATGETVTEKSKLSLHNDTAGVYDGEVKSQVPKCERGRHIAVYHDENGNNDLDTEDFRIGRAVTNSDGKYTINGNQAPAGDTLIGTVAGDKGGRKLFCKQDVVLTKALSG